MEFNLESVNPVNMTVNLKQFLSDKEIKSVLDANDLAALSTAKSTIYFLNERKEKMRVTHKEKGAMRMYGE